MNTNGLKREQKHTDLAQKEKKKWNEVTSAKTSLQCILNIVLFIISQWFPTGQAAYFSNSYYLEISLGFNV